MARLGSSVHDCIRFDLADKVQDLRPVPYVNFVMAKTGKLFFEAFPVPGRVSLGPKKFPPHVVIKPVDLPRLTTKKCYDFAADEAA